jgi:hypothetical protein
MQIFTTLELVQAAIHELHGYVPSSLTPSRDVMQETIGDVTYRSEYWTYAQEAGTTNTFKTRRCIICQVTEDGEDDVWKLSLPVVSETPEGTAKVVNSFSGPDEYYPYTFSVWGHMARDGSDATKVRADGSAWQQGDDDADCYFKKSFTNVLAFEYGFQNIVACWARFNEGDTCDVFVDIPGAWAAAAAQAAGADSNTVAYLNSLDWYQHAQFGEDITMFGSNPAGTTYPPDTSPAMSWIPAGARLRFDLYKKVIDDPEFLLGTNETETTNPEKRGPFLDLDLLGQRKR